jgi:AcrR family transcriptional regulator
MPDNPEKTRAARDRLLEVGLRFFARKGYERAGVGEMAREARVTTGSIYALFRDKEDFFLAVADRLVENLVFELRQLSTDFEDSETAVTSLASRYRSFVNERPEWPLMLNELLRYRAAHGDSPRAADDLMGCQLLERESAAALDRLALGLRRQLRWQSTAIVRAAGISLHALALERARDPAAMPDDLFDHLTAAIIGWSLQRMPIRPLGPGDVIEEAEPAPYVFLERSIDHPRPYFDVPIAGRDTTKRQMPH